MRCLLLKCSAVFFVVYLAVGLGQAKALSKSAPSGLASQSSATESIAFYGFRCVGSCRLYRYWQPPYRSYRYYDPYIDGYHYKPYYKPQRYRYRPHRRRGYPYW